MSCTVMVTSDDSETGRLHPDGAEGFPKLD